MHFVTVGHVRLLIVIPALNEQKTLGSLLEEIEAARRQIPHTVDAVVIDDGSTDGTSAIAAQHGCRVVRLCGNLGIGGAVQTGLRLAFAEGFDCAVQIDADGQHPPDQIGRLLAELAPRLAPRFRCSQADAARNDLPVAIHVKEHVWRSNTFGLSRRFYGPRDVNYDWYTSWIGRPEHSPLIILSARTALRQQVPAGEFDICEPASAGRSGG